MNMLGGRLEAAGVPHDTLLIPYAQHGFDYVVGGFSSQILEAALLKFLGGA
jgi:acetyl esterase/lipase